MNHSLLIIEDDCLLAEAAADYFSSKGWQVRTEGNGIRALRLLEKTSFDLILLDVMIPGMDGFALCRRIRRSSNVPLIFITARVLEEDQLNGYALGGDDYVTKPFSLPVLYAKAMALTGRVRECAGTPSPEASAYTAISAPYTGDFPDSIAAGSLRVEPQSHKVWNHGQLLALPPREYEMLVFFLENPGRIFSREQLLIRFWGYDFEGNERVVDNHIKKLRKALGDWGHAIQTVRKSGYRLDIPEQLQPRDSSDSP